MKLPEGWTSNEYDDCTVLVAPGGIGYVTVSEQRRAFSLGLDMPPLRQSNYPIYSGLGWRTKLYEAAFSSLQQVLNG